MNWLPEIMPTHRTWMPKVSEQASRNQTNSRLNVIRGVVLNVVERERHEVDSKTNLAIVGSTRRWREIEVRTAGDEDFWVSGEVVYGARTGDEIALVFDARGREPLALANLSDGNQFVHSSADSNAKEGKGVWAIAWLITVLGAIPGLLLFMMLFMIVLPSWTEQNTGQVFKL